ncbi:MAG: peptidylprolyl isomerase [Byssovorax sp.]
MRTRLLSAARPAAFVLASLTAAACGGEPPPPPAAPTAAVEAPPPPAATAAAAATSNPAAEACIAAANASRARFSGEPAKIKVKHILVMYKGGKKAEGIARTRQEACLRAIEARDKIRGGADFGEIVKQYSDEPGAATRDGMIGEVERKMLVKPFADAAFELSINQLSDVVETEFGFHIILRTQ